jgi:DNA-binding CsgD family transcriptional regulator
MHSDKTNIGAEGLRKELDFFKTIVQSIPAVVFIIEVESPRDVESCHNIWMNQRGLDFIGYSQEEITNMRYGFFNEIIHPNDLGVVSSTIQTILSTAPHLIMIAMFRIKAKGRNDYSWIYSPYVALDSFKDGSPKRILCAAFEITESMQSENQLVMVLKEINRLKHELKQCNFTRREKEILALIVRGKTDKDIAKNLCISIVTAKKHRNNLIKKAGVKNSAELVAMAVESIEF